MFCKLVVMRDLDVYAILFSFLFMFSRAWDL